MNIGAGTMSLQDGIVGDAMSITGGLTGNGGTLAFDVDFSAGAGGAGTQADIITVSGAVTGEFVISIDNVGGPLGQQGADIVLLNVDDTLGASNNYTFALEPGGVLPFNTQTIFLLTQSAGGDLILRDEVNPGVSGIAGAIALSQSLIGALVNRPTSPFVSGLALPTEDKCGYGAWTRVTGGQVNAQGVTTDAASNLSVKSDLSATYYGLQFGGDFGCFQGHYSGWDLAFGGIGGVNLGSITQPVFGINGATRTSNNIVESVTGIDFDQRYLGAYVTASKDRWTMDLQIRSEETEFTATNVSVVANQDLELTNASFDVKSTTVSGAISYAIPLKADGWNVVPTLGFSFSDTETSNVVFDNGSVLEFEDSTSLFGFLGGTVSKVKVSNDGTSALNYFGTATYYADLSDDLGTKFSNVLLSGLSNLDSSTLRDYAELSLGMNYIKVFDKSETGRPLRQFNAAVRADLRGSSTLDSAALTGQIRFQF